LVCLGLLVLEGDPGNCALLLFIPILAIGLMYDLAALSYVLVPFAACLVHSKRSRGRKLTLLLRSDFNVVEFVLVIGKAHLQVGFPTTRLLLIKVPLAFLAPAKADRALGHDDALGGLVKGDRLPLGIIGLAQVSGKSEARSSRSGTRVSPRFTSRTGMGMSVYWRP
jgi:hypothetical protein